MISPVDFAELDAMAFDDEPSSGSRILLVERDRTGLSSP
jgi:hypothetical protein